MRAAWVSGRAEDGEVVERGARQSWVMSAKEDAVVRYRIDAARSRFTAQAFAHGLLSFVGHDPLVAVCGFGGDVRCVPGTLARASLLLLVSADALAVVGDVGEKDRREMERALREEVLETARYPEIVFVSTGVAARRLAESQYEVTIDGQLSLHGVTRPQQIAAQVSLNDHDLRARGECTLRQSDYNIKRVSAVGGALQVKDELKLSFDIVASEQ